MGKKIFAAMCIMTLMFAFSIVGMASEQPEVEGTVKFEVGEQVFKFLRYDIGTDYEGNLAIILAFDYTNKSEEANMAASDFYIQIFQNGIEKDMCILDNDSQWADWDKNLTTDIKDGVTLTVCRAYLLEDAQSSIDVEVSELVNFDETQKMTIEISQYSGSVPETESETELIKTYESEYVEMSENYAELQSEYEALQSEYEALQLKYNLTEATAPETEFQEKQKVNDSGTDPEENDEKYADMLVKYGDIFTNELSVFSNQQISQLIKDNASVSELTEEITSSLSEVSTAEENLQNYYDQFDSNRTEPPMGTPIMTLLSHAQSALRQYNIALQHLEDYFSNPKQEYIDDFVKYTGKATESLNAYNELLIKEKNALGMQ